MSTNDVLRGGLSGRWVRRGGSIVLLPGAGSQSGEMEAETGPIPATTQGVIHPAIDVHAQHALMRMSRSGAAAQADAWGMLAAARGNRLGIYKEDQQKPALRAKKLGAAWWTVIPASEDAAVLTDPSTSQPPFIVFRDRVKNDPARLDPALRKAWQTFGMLDRCVAPAGYTADMLPGARVPANLFPRLVCGAGPIGPRSQPPCPMVDRTQFTSPDLRKKLEREKIRALVLHQMAFSRGNDVERYDDVVAHYAILPNGTILRLHPDSAYLFASGGFNRYSVAVEFAGNFPNEQGRCWQPPGGNNGCHTLTHFQVAAGQCLVRHLIKNLGITEVLAHRQSSGQRDNDPGPAVWLAVGQWAVNTLGLGDGGPGFKIGSGKPIPPSWRVP